MKTTKAYIAVSLSMLFWSLSFIWTKDALQFYGPLTILSFRLIMAATILFVSSSILGVLNKIVVSDIKYLALLSMFEPFLYFIGETYGLQRVSPTIAAVIIATIPLFLPYAGKVFFGEPITKYKIFGTSLSFLGVMLVILDNSMKLNADALGILLLFLAVISAIGYASVLKKISVKYNAVTIVSWQSLIGIFGFVPLFFLFEKNQTLETGLLWQGFKYLLVLGLFGSILAFVFFTYSIKILGITRSGVFGNVIPVLTCVFSFFLIGEKLLLLNYIGVFIVLIGLIISQYGKK
jgi:drug/metabolite transporter (DMT)-like permease